MAIPICARCHTVLLPSVLSGSHDMIYCPNCDEDILLRDYETTVFEASPLYAVTLVPAYAAELDIAFMISDDFQADNLIRLGVASEKVLVQNEHTLVQMIARLSQQRKSKNASESTCCCKMISAIKERRTNTMFKKHDPNVTDANAPILPAANLFSTSIPPFFIIRMTAWFAMAVLTAIASLTLCLTSKKLDASLVLGAILSALMLYKGLDLLHTARKRKYFVLELECVEITERSLKDVRNIWDPTSQTAFRKTALVSFVDTGGMRLQFIFDAGRRFVVGSTYDFYFRRPQNASTPITVEMLEQLKIDHEVKVVQVTGAAIPDPVQATSDTQKQRAHGRSLDTNLYKTGD